MARSRRHFAWIWPALLLAGLAAVVAFRVWSGWATRPMAASTDRADGRVEGERADLAAAGRRLRHLRQRLTDIRRRLADLQVKIADRRRHLRTLDEMLAGGRLTACPPVLRDETTVRALQKIIREAEEPAQAEDGRRSRLATAATIARERLRARLSALREQFAREVADLETGAEALRHERRLQEAGLRRLRRKVSERLDGRSAQPAAPCVQPDDRRPAG